MTKLGRNDPCHCGSGSKYKKCCETKDEAADNARAKATLDAVEAAALEAVAAEAAAGEAVNATGGATGRTSAAAHAKNAPKRPTAPPPMPRAHRRGVA
jgi:hypothetical protein